MTFSPSQQKAYDAIQKGENAFITASAGYGKSFLTRAITTPNTVVVAPTGIAALNVGGTTCHRTFGLPIGLIQPKDKYIIPKSMQIFKGNAVKRIVFSEIGMVRTDQLELIDARLKAVRNNKLPFGGIQVVAEGDYHQLEPIVGNLEKEVFYSQYKSPFCFTAKCWNFTTYELLESQRQANPVHASLLNRVRKGDTTALKEIVEISKPYNGDNPNTIHLCGYKDSARTINNVWYNKLEGKTHSFKASTTGQVSKGEKPVDEILNLKVGCRVLLKANDINGQYVNGDRGTVTDLSYGRIGVMLDSGKEVFVERFTWTVYKYTLNGMMLNKDVVGTYTQFSITLGWAITIHASQGTTLDDVAVDVGRGCFSHGQLYVALSRVKDLTNQSFVNPINPSDLIIRQEVIDFYERRLERT